MNRREFGKLIAALRKEHFDPVVGKVWTQQMLAEKSGLLPRTIGEIERGQKATLDADTLLRLAAAFRFTTLERREFFAAATEVDEADVSRDTGNAERIFRELWGTMGKLYLPAVLHDAFFDLLAVNTLYRGFHNLPAKLPGTMGGDDALQNVNFLSLFFGPHAPLRTAAPHSWRTLARACVRHFRTMTLRYRHTRYF